MSLNQQYTWAQFLKEHPDMKAKKVKRTSPEGDKAFQAAFKKYIKDYLKGRETKIEAQKKRATAHKSLLVEKQKELVKTKKWPKVKRVQTKIGRNDASLARLGKQAERNKLLQKNF